MSRTLGSVLAVLIVLPMLAEIERRMILRPVLFIPGALLVGIAARYSPPQSGMFSVHISLCCSKIVRLPPSNS